MKEEKDELFSKGSKALYGSGELLGVKQSKNKKRIIKGNKNKFDLRK